MADRIKCSRCDRMILEATAHVTGGLCGFCKKAHDRAEFDRTVAGWAANPETIPGTNGIPEPEDFALALAAQQLRDMLEPDEYQRMEMACHRLFQVAHDRWAEHGPSCLSDKERHVLAVETFYGEVLNGGLLQYLGNQSGAFAGWAAEAFETIGIRAYAKLMRKVEKLFPDQTIPEDSDDRWELVEAIGDKRLERIERGFWNRYWKNKEEIRRKLYEYLID